MSPAPHGRRAPFEAALETFLEPWRRRPEVIGALVCGSYVTGAPSEHSDLDVHLLLSPGTGWQERGNRVVDGYLVEYFANPAAEIRSFFRSDRTRHRLMTATMFATGRPIFDERGTLARLVREAERELRKPFPRLARTEVEKLKYWIWDSLDNLADIHDRGLPLGHAYHDHVQGVYADYARFLRQPILPAYQLHRYLTDARARRKYRQRAFPDPRFRRLLVPALEARDPHEMVSRAEVLSAHALRRMGGIRIDGWRVRLPLRR